MGVISALCWLMACLLTACTARAIFRFKRLKFSEGAFAIYMGMGISIVFTAVWYVCSLTGLLFNSYTVLAGTVIIMALSVYYRYKKGYFYVDEAGDMDRDRRTLKKEFLFGFLMFALLFGLAVYVKGYKPFIDHQTEQYMDFGFVKAMYRQQRLPFEDLWAAGRNVNYYYLGQAVTVFLCRLSFVSPEYGYNYMLATLFAALTMSVFSLIRAFVSVFTGDKKGVPLLSGIVSALLCSCGGNGHFIVCGIFEQALNRLFIHDKDPGYWFPSSTLFIGYDPDTLDKAKHEFPAYTLVLGDLHAHVCNMLFTIPLLAVLIDYVLKKDDEWEGDGRYISSHTVLMGILLGLFRGVNMWDFPIYFVVCGAVILFADMRKRGISLYTLAYVLIKGLIIFLTGFILMLPFSLRYKLPAAGLHFCDRHSPLYKLVIIWFPYIIGALFLLVLSFGKLLEKKEGERDDKRMEEDIGFLTVIAITLCAIGLILLPEIIYVKDIYGYEYERYNTMFKLTFQAFILLSMMMGVTVGLLLNEKEKYAKVPAGILLLLSLLLIFYMPWSVRSWFGNVLKTDKWRGITAVDPLMADPSYDDLREAVRIINKDERRKVHIIEESGDSYSPENRLSTLTGAPCVCGWFVHEWVWRNDPEAIKQRRAEVRAFYESGDEEYCRKLADKYALDYIYVGSSVRKRYNVAYEGFLSMGERVWEDPDRGYMLIRLSPGTQ